MNQLLLIGYFQETVELCERAGFQIVGIVDSAAPKCQYRYIGTDTYVLAHASEYNGTPVCIVPDSPKVRKKLFGLYKGEGFRVQTVVSPKAAVSESAIIGEGCMIQDFCNISANVILGDGVRVNTMANVMHDSVIGDFTTVAPNAVVLGRCRSGSECYIGANATILPEMTVGNRAVVGAGAVVTKAVCEGAVVVGVPAKPIKG